jgi:hypothetical protein
MSRSRRHTPAICWCGKTNKRSKQTCNRIFRHRSIQNIRNGLEPLHNRNEALNIWEFDKDGKAVYNKDLEQKYLRK